MYRLFIEKNITTEELLKKVLKKYHIKYDIFYNENRKPYVKNNPIYFNISHSGEYIVCVVSDKEIGVDIQEVYDSSLPDLFKFIIDNKKS